MLDFFKPKDKIDASPSVNKPITQSVSCTTISETSDVESVSQDEFSIKTSVDDIIVEKQPSKDDIDLVHIEDEFILEPHIFKFLCFFKPSSDGKLKCQLPHVTAKQLNCQTSEKYCLNPKYKSLRRHIDYAHKGLTPESIRNLTEYKFGSTTISLMSLVMINNFLYELNV